MRHQSCMLIGDSVALFIGVTSFRYAVRTTNKKVRTTGAQLSKISMASNFFCRMSSMIDIFCSREDDFIRHNLYVLYIVGGGGRSEKLNFVRFFQSPITCLENVLFNFNV